ncbi:spore germination protein [Anaerosinus massiliensis]|uniref:spore germination protein n=1 Tax=Massilibacillus massiliensis TaxID=1806837 RepID=UPI000B0DD690|nr:spore germination protein [Massilibacillus massiliensis]
MWKNFFGKLFYSLKPSQKKRKLRPIHKKEGTEFYNLSDDDPVPNTSTIAKDLSVNLLAIKDIFKDCSDIIIREFKAGTKQELDVFVVMIDGLVETRLVNENLIKALLLSRLPIHKSNALPVIETSILPVTSIKKTNYLNEAVDAVLSGDTMLFIDGSEVAIIASIRGWESRNVEEPDTEAVVRGPRQGFIETLRNNTALLRRYIKTPNLKTESIDIGTQTKTEICVMYIKGIANEKIVQEVKRRLSRIEIDSILESGYIEAFIEDAPYSPFPTVGNSEKPDVVSGKLLEGRIAILVDGTPFVLTVPYLFVEAFQSSEDYYLRPYYTNFIRPMRWLAFYISTFLPALYVAITTFHQEILPPPLLLSIAAAQEGTPFPSVIEAILMQIIYEILKEAGVRLPRPIGQAISIVGALVIGEAAVSAGLIGAPMVVIVALTAIASFVVPSLGDVNVLARLGLLILSGFAGLYGVIMGFVFALIHQCSLRSFGVPYMSPIAPFNLSGMKDVFIRVPWWTMISRPNSLDGENLQRQKHDQIPHPPNNEN